MHLGNGELEEKCIALEDLVLDFFFRKLYVLISVIEILKQKGGKEISADSKLAN